MKTFIYTFNLLLSLFILQPSYAENNWTYYLGGNDINAITIKDDTIYCATTAGLVIWDRLTGTYRQHMYFAEDGCCQYQRTNFGVVTPGKDGIVWTAIGGDLLMYDGSKWIVYTIGNIGLRGGINAIFTDNHNVVWITSLNGAASYDGVSWKTYINEETGNNLTGMLGIDKTNLIWFLTETGISSFDGTTWRTYTENDGLPDMKVNAMAVGPDNVKWFSTRTKSILSFDGTNWVTHEGIGWHASSIVVDSNNNVWCGTGVGIYKYDGTTWYYYNYDNSSLPCNDIDALAIDSEDILWVANGSGRYDEMGLDKTIYYRGLLRFDVLNSTRWLVNGPLDTNVRCAVVDHNNVKWFGTSSRGLAKFDGTEWVNYTMADSIRLSMVNRLAVGPDNVLWIGYASKYRDRIDGRMETWFVYGLLSFDGTQWVKYPEEVTGIPQNWLSSITVDHDNVVWISGGGNAVRFDGTKWTTYDKEITGYTLEGPVAVDNNNVIWFGSDTNAISYNRESWTYCPFEGLKQDFHKIVVDNDNVKWFLTRNWGVCSFDGDIWNQYDFNYANARNLLPDHTVNIVDDMDVDSKGVEWFLGTEYHDGFAGGGLMSFDGEAWEYHRDNFWLVYAANCLAIDYDNVKWVGTHSGIARYEGDHDNVTTDVNETTDIPVTLKMISTFPNPFNPSTTITFSLPFSGFTTLDIYNISGQKIRTLLSETLLQGTHSTVWDSSDDKGEVVSSGLYFSRVRSGDNEVVGRMVLLR
ncbi:T9SS type A sorting domain-containing protein [Candidatus Latescibacterota bacterium]